MTLDPLSGPSPCQAAPVERCRAGDDGPDGCEGPVRRILLVEDNPDHVALTMRALRRQFPGVVIEHAATAEDGELLFAAGEWDAVVVDYSLPHANGLDLLARMSRMRPHLPVIMLTGHGDEQVAVAAMKQGAADYVTKSGEYWALLASSVDAAIEHMRLVRDRERLARTVAQRNRQLSVVNAVAVAVSRSLRLKEMLGEVLAEVTSATGMAAAVLIPNGGNGKLELVAHRGLTGDEAAEMQALAATVKWADRMHGCHGPHGWRCFPLAPEGAQVGLLAVVPRSPAGIGESDAEMLATLAHVIGMGVRNALLFEETRALSLQDELTGLGNRRLFAIRLRSDFEASKRYGTRLALVLLDTDHFKRVNDTYGHLAGDAVLRHLGAVLLAHSRGSDLIFRYGGDEFAMLLPHTGLDAAVRAAERVRHIVAAEEFAVPGGVVRITLSAGVAGFTRSMAGEQELVDLADQALYEAKKAGRDQVRAREG